eukprot:gnl/TRDRNA2_/TRDRNA2_124890_c0_seq1.p1 gnl/TRDRNA2_/TRDRNA2_124890_c0~~gnl/TRDRNA2_/TRDRNA2_124890_c0_seq1.p1  ORF type:complete len:167 (+),score=18.45 gnl/TRDRNA2_/TRDRNA2_124890_c0_seq1:142-642(+)
MCNVQTVAGTPQVFTTVQVCSSFTTLGEHRIDDLVPQELNARVLSMILWACVQHDSWKDVWGICDSVVQSSAAIAACWSGMLLMECEQRGLFAHELAFLRGLELEGTTDDHGAEAGFRKVTKHASIMHVDGASHSHSLDSQCEVNGAALACLWCASDECSLSLLDH